MSMYRRRLLMQQALRPRFPMPIASYRCYDKTNDDEDRDVLTDLTSNGHDIKLYNFGFAEGSGYGKYSYNFTNRSDEWQLILNRANFDATYNKITVNEVLQSESAFCYLKSFPIGAVFKIKLKVTGLSKNNTVLRIGATNYYVKTIEKDGIYNINITNDGNNLGPSEILGFNIPKLGKCDIVIEQIPEYKGAIVSDGVDDYGLCENFPILTKERGYTVCAIRKWLNTEGSNKVFLSNSKEWLNTDTLGAFNIEITATQLKNSYTFGRSNNIENSFNPNTSFIYQTSKQYNNQTLNADKNVLANNVLVLFTGTSSTQIWKSSIALYALEIYDRDLTDEEIEQVKARMIAEYEAKTGNRYDETGALVADYEAYDKTNEDDSRAVLEDLTGNGHDINLYNFGFNEESGYNKSVYKGALVSDGVDDYGLCENFPILNSIDGYTVLAIREWIQQETNSNAIFLSNADTWNTLVLGAFNIENLTKTNSGTYTFGASTYITNTINKNLSFVSQKSNKYNNQTLPSAKLTEGNNVLNVFCNSKSSKGWNSSIALYALKIYNRDLTDEEIEKEKAKMIKRYEEKTGEKYTEV